MVTEFNKIFSSWQPCQVVERRVNQQFKDHLWEMITSMIYLPEPLAHNWWRDKRVGGQSQVLLCLVLLLHSLTCWL